jgi:UDP-2,4-diacetamido-2,4,6-trideoxy-beta-L-altropyranose hydrolase
MGMGPTPTVLRADAGAAIGIGHAMRCLAVGQAMRDRSARVVFATRDGAPGVEAKMRAEGIEIVRVPAAGGDESEMETVRIARDLGAAWTVVDGGRVNAEVVDALHAARCRVVMIDDEGGASAGNPDVIVNQNTHATLALYAECSGRTRRLLGPAYALLRREFRERAGWHRDFQGPARNVLVTLGGSDPDNATGVVLSAIEHVGVELDVIVVIGASNSHADAVDRQAAKSRVRVRIERDTSRMSELMAWADVAVSSGGSTVWEIAFMGLPSLVGSIAADQGALVASSPFFESLGAFRAVRPEFLARALRELVLDPARRAAQSAKARAVVDGRGCERVLNVLSEIDRQARGRSSGTGTADRREARDERE